MMRPRLRLLWRFVAYVIRARKVWRWPRQRDVLIFDACNHDILLDYLKSWAPEILHVRGEQINMRVLVASLLRAGNRLDAYLDCFIERVRPRLIVTFIDNNVHFLAISRRHPAVKTLFVQNGWRGYYADIFQTLDEMDAGRRSELAVDHMLSFGTVVGAEFARYIAGAVVITGSIKNNKIPTAAARQPGMIAFVSQWQSEGFYMGDIFYTPEAFFAQADRPIVQCLAHYASRNAKRLMIIPRNVEQGDERGREEAYYRNLLGQDAEFFEPQVPYPSYQAVDAADVVVAVDTTLAYEAIARGKKTAIFSVRSTLLGIPGLTYGWPREFPAAGPFWTNDPDPDTFVRILDHLFEIDDVQWRKDLEDTDFASLMIYNPGNSILQSLLEKELGSAAR